MPFRNIGSRQLSKETAGMVRGTQQPHAFIDSGALHLLLVLAIAFLFFPSVATSVVAVARDRCCVRGRCLLDAGGARSDVVGRFFDSCGGAVYRAGECVFDGVARSGWSAGVWRSLCDVRKRERLVGEEPV